MTCVRKQEWVAAVRDALALGRAIIDRLESDVGDLDAASSARALEALRRTLAEHETDDGVMFAGHPG